jgi:hypothetical protein
MLIGCFVMTVSLGCSKSTGPQAANHTSTKQTNSDDFSEPQDVLELLHGSVARTDYGNGPEVRLDAITLKAPPTWKRTKPASSYYLAEFVLPHADKDTTDARLMVSQGTGSIETNLDVFKAQFNTAGENAKQEQKEIAGLQVTLIDVSGTYTGQHSQSAPATLPGYRMIVAVIPIGEQLHFVKAVGPQQTIAVHADAIKAFVGSVQLPNSNAETHVAAPGNDAEVRLGPITLTAPATWKRTKPRSSFVQAEFVLPQANKNSAEGRLTVSIVGGTIKDNIDRWKGQFVGAIDSAKQEETEIGVLKATLVDFTGTFGDQAGMMAPVVNRPNYRMIAAIIPVSDQLYVIKAVGPRQTISANVDAINSFLGSLNQDD